MAAKLSTKKAVILLGPRQAGKSTLVQQLLGSLKVKALQLNGDEPQVRAALRNAGLQPLQFIIGMSQLLVIDEAQRIENIGLAIKIVIDQLGSTQILATASSSFELGNTINEPLTGRKWEFFLSPLEKW